MSRLIRFDGRVAVVTGAGNGLGKAYALLFAQRGASVVVNDLGGNVHGSGNTSEAADKVVQEIESKGGKAVANYDSVTEGEKIVQTALNKFGRIDILVNNAGILRDKSFGKMTEDDWSLIQQVHLNGAFKTTRAAWDTFRSQQYGRIVNTSSASGIFGNFGQANYAAAKCGLIGFSNTLAREGERFNIHSNCIVPMAQSRMTETIIPPDVNAELKPSLIAPVVAWLCHEDCADSGMVVESAAGFARRYQWVSSKGSLLRSSKAEDVTIESVKEKWDKITDMTNPHTPTSVNDTIIEYVGFMEQIESKK